MAASAPDYPELAAAFYEAGPGTVLETVAACLEAAREREKLIFPDAAVAAEQLVSSWLGVDQLKQSLAVGGPPTQEAVSRRVKTASEAFSWPGTTVWILSHRRKTHFRPAVKLVARRRRYNLRAADRKAQNSSALGAEFYAKVPILRAGVQCPRITKT
jgi:hypothetical protein